MSSLWTLLIDQRYNGSNTSQMEFPAAIPLNVLLYVCRTRESRDAQLICWLSVLSWMLIGMRRRSSVSSAWLWTISCFLQRSLQLVRWEITQIQWFKWTKNTATKSFKWLVCCSIVKISHVALTISVRCTPLCKLFYLCCFSVHLKNSVLFNSFMQRQKLFHFVNVEEIKFTPLIWQLQSPVFCCKAFNFARYLIHEPFVLTYKPVIMGWEDLISSLNQQSGHSSYVGLLLTSLTIGASETTCDNWSSPMLTEVHSTRETSSRMSVSWGTDVQCTLVHTG